MGKKTLVIGASENPQRYAWKATQRLKAAGHDVILLGQTAGYIGELPILTSFPVNEKGIHTITLYIRPEIQKLYTDAILRLHPQRIIFNPGTENPELESLAQQAGIEPMEACTLVLLSTGEY